MNRIAPNNQLPATHFIEVWKTPTSESGTFNGKIHLIKYFELVPISILWPTVAIFRIRENKLPTKHKF